MLLPPIIDLIMELLPFFSGDHGCYNASYNRFDDDVVPIIEIVKALLPVLISFDKTFTSVIKTYTCFASAVY